MKKSILVTGPAGFIGSNFVAQFRKQFPKIAVIGIDDLSTGRKEALHPDLVFYKGSVLDKRLLENIFKKHRPQFVFHFAAVPRVSYSVEHPTETSMVNIVGTVQVLELASKYKARRVVYSSSSSVYGGAKKLPTKESENPPFPISPYALQKYAGEPFCRIFSSLYGLDTAVLRYFNVFGPGQYGGHAYATVISAWLEGLYFPKNKKLFIEGNGTQSRDFCFIDNVVQANIQAMQFKKKLNGEVFNIAHGERKSLLEIQKLIETGTGKILRPERRPSRTGDVRHSHADISKARKWLGYRPIPFKEGLQRTIAWFEQRIK